MDGDFNEATKDAYVALRTEGRHALLGQWTDPDGRRFRGTVFAVSGIGRREAATGKLVGDENPWKVGRMGGKEVWRWSNP